MKTEVFAILAYLSCSQSAQQPYNYDYNPDPYQPQPNPYQPQPNPYQPQGDLYEPAPYNPTPAPAPYKPVKAIHPAHYQEEEENYSPKPFAYEYGGADSSGRHFAKTETSDDDGVVRGEYRVELPDGRVQIVSYTADHENGYQADVRYEGEAKPYVPEPQQYEEPRQPYVPQHKPYARRY